VGASAEEFVLRRRRLSPAYKKLEAKYGRDQEEFDRVLAQAGFYSARHGKKFDDGFWKEYDESMGLEEMDMDLGDDDAPSAPRKPRVTRKRAPSKSSPSRSAAGLTRKQKRAANRAAWRAGERW